MLDIKFVRENPEKVKENIKKKFQDQKLELVDKVLELDTEYRDIKVKADNFRNERNTISDQIGQLMRDGKKEEGLSLKEKVTKINIQFWLKFLSIDKRYNDENTKYSCR